jgi:hypothetical protein
MDPLSADSRSGGGSVGTLRSGYWIPRVEKMKEKACLQKKK